MELPKTRLEILQVKKLANLVRKNNFSHLCDFLDNSLKNIPNLKDPVSGESSLHVAVALNYDRVTSFLIENGANVNLPSNGGVSPLMIAAEHGHIQVLEILILNGVDLNATDECGATAAFYCLKNTSRHGFCLEIMLNAGANPNHIRSTDEEPLLVVACKAGEFSSTKILLDKGASPHSSVTKLKKSALMFSSELGYTKCVLLLSQYQCDLEATDIFGWTAAHFAASKSHFEVLTALSAFCADFSTAAHPDHNTPLHIAALQTDHFTCKFLSQRGANSELLNNDCFSSKQIVLQKLRKDIYRDLKKIGDLRILGSNNVKTKGFTSLNIIHFYDWIQSFKFELFVKLKSIDTLNTGELCKSEMNQIFLEFYPPCSEIELTEIFDHYTKNKDIPINYKTFLQSCTFIPFSYKISPHDITGKAKKIVIGKMKKKVVKNKMKAIDIPCFSSSEVSTDMIFKYEYLSDVSRFPRTNNSYFRELSNDSKWYLTLQEKQFINIYNCIYISDIASLEFTLKYNSNLIDQRDKYNKTPLMIAASHGNIQLVDWLLKNGSDVNAYDNFHWQSIHHATNGGHINVVIRLIQSGAEINSKTINGCTALIRAIENSNIGMFKLLLNYGAKSDSKNILGKSPLDIAMEWGDNEMLIAVRGMMNDINSTRNIGINIPKDNVALVNDLCNLPKINSEHIDVFPLKKDIFFQCESSNTLNSLICDLHIRHDASSKRFLTNDVMFAPRSNAVTSSTQHHLLHFNDVNGYDRPYTNCFLARANHIEQLEL